MKIAIGSDHHGIGFRMKLNDLVARLGHEPLDFGPKSEDDGAVDYPDVASEVAGRVSNGEVDRGILICGTGIGMSIAANKYCGVRAAPVVDELNAELSRRHNDLNVLCLSGDHVNDQTADRMIEIWLETPFEGGRHERRVHKIESFERENSCKREVSCD